MCDLRMPDSQAGESSCLLSAVVDRVLNLEPVFFDLLVFVTELLPFEEVFIFDSCCHEVF